MGGTVDPNARLGRWWPTGRRAIRLRRAIATALFLGAALLGIAPIVGPTDNPATCVSAPDDG